MILLPATRIVWTRVDIFEDGPDDGSYPDVRPRVRDKYTLRPSIRQPITYTDPTTLVTINVQDVSVRHNLQGELVTMSGGPVHVLSTDAEGLNYTDWVWTVVEVAGLRFPAPSSETVDISEYIKTPATEDVKLWVNKIPELSGILDDTMNAAQRAEAAAQIAELGGWSPEDIEQAITDHLVANPLEGVSQQQLNAAVNTVVENTVPQALSGQPGRFRGVYSTQPTTIPDAQIGDFILVLDP